MGRSRRWPGGHEAHIPNRYGATGDDGQTVIIVSVRGFLPLRLPPEP
jgi:hypothetical protein